MGSFSQVTEMKLTLFTRSTNGTLRWRKKTNILTCQKEISELFHDHCQWLNLANMGSEGRLNTATNATKHNLTSLSPIFRPAIPNPQLFISWSTYVFSVNHGFDAGSWIIALWETCASWKCSGFLWWGSAGSAKTLCWPMKEDYEATYIIPSSRTFTFWVQFESVQKKVLREG